VKPQLDDLLVFSDTAYGHVAIISEVGDGYIEVIQQNSEVSRQKYEVHLEDGNYTIEGERTPSGWLRVR
ncbi:MAG: CHAP domain-containing protein, partial [Eubacteriales bacterium]